MLTGEKKCEDCRHEGCMCQIVRIGECGSFEHKSLINAY